MRGEKRLKRRPGGKGFRGEDGTKEMEKRTSASEERR